MRRKNQIGLAVAVSGVVLLLSGTVHAEGLGLFCHCPPPLKWCSEQAPCIKFKCACPRPVCDPCSLQHYGYYLTCWQPWPFPADWTHCPTPPPAAMLPPPAYPPYTPRAPQEPRYEERRQEELHNPRMSNQQMTTPQVRNLSYSTLNENPVVPPPQVQIQNGTGVRMIR